MPRDPEREAAIAADRQRAYLELQRQQLPDRERVLAGWVEVRRYLHDDLRLRRRSGQPLTLTQLRHWRARNGLPIAGGGALIPTRGGIRRTLCMTTTSMLLAWVLAQKTGRLFTVRYPGLDQQSQEASQGGGQRLAALGHVDARD